MTNPLSDIDLASAILGLSNDGDRLEPAHLALVESAINGVAKSKGIDKLRDILRELEAGTYRKSWLQGIEPLTTNHKGHILYKSYIVEHYEHPYNPSNKAALEELAKRCHHIEVLGLIPSTNLATFHWKWLEDLLCVPRQLLNALSLYDLYRHTQTAEIIGHFNHHARTLRGFLTMYREANTWRIHFPTDMESDWISDYHGVQRNGYKPMRFVESSNTGLSGQPRDLLLTLLEDIGVPVDFHLQASKTQREFEEDHNQYVAED